MEIVLIRHGKPTGATYPRCSANEFERWVEAYDQSGIDPLSKPAAGAYQRFADHHVISSNLKRAVESTSIGFGREPVAALEIFRELAIPVYKLPFNMKASSWLYLNRVLWTLGVKCVSESYKAARLRSQQASLQLVQLAQQYDKVVLFSHGYINFFIRRNLAAHGWSITEKSSEHWGVTRLVYNDNKAE